jgi:hypothetical protein
MDDSGGLGAPPPPPPPGAGGGGQIPQRGLGDILSVAFDVYKANAAKLIQIVAIVVIPLTFVLALLTQVAFKQHCDVENIQTLNDLTANCVTSALRSLSIGAIGYFIAVAIQQLLLGALTRGGAGALIGREVDVSESYRYAFSRLGGLIGLALLIALVVGVGFILLVIPGIIFLVFLAVAVPAFIIERLGVTESMSRSWKLVSGSWWHVLGVIFVAGIIAGVINGILTAIGGNTFFGVWILSAIGQIITAPFVALVGIVLYVDLRARHEGLDATTLAGDLDRR